MWGQIVVPSDQSYDNKAVEIDVPYHSDRPEPGPWMKYARHLIFGDEFTFSPSISLHPSHGLLAVVRKNVVSIYGINSSKVPVGFGAPLNLSRQRISSTINCLAWTHECQSTFLLGTGTGLYYCVLPNRLDEQHFNATNTEIKQIQLPVAKICIDAVSTSPQGRVFVCASSKQPGVVYVGDAWMGNASALYCIDRSDSISQLCWMQPGHSIAALTKGNSVVLVNSYRWDWDSYSLDAASGSGSAGTCIASMAPIMQGSGMLVSYTDSLNVYHLELAETADLSGVLVPQTQALRATLDTSLLSADSRLVVRSLACSAEGDLLAVTFRRVAAAAGGAGGAGDADAFPKVAVYSCLREKNKLSATFLRDISRSEGAAWPVSVSLAAVASRQAGRSIVYVLWSDDVFTFHSL